MSKIENVTSDLRQTDRPLRDDELDTVNGGCCNGGHDVGRPAFGGTALGNLGLLQNYRPMESI